MNLLLKIDDKNYYSCKYKIFNPVKEFIQSEKKNKGTLIELEK